MGWVGIVVQAVAAAYQARESHEARKEQRQANETLEQYNKRIADAAAAEAEEKKRLADEARSRQEGKLRDLEAKRIKRAQEASEGSTLKTGVDVWNKQRLGQ